MNYIFGYLCCILATSTLILIVLYKNLLLKYNILIGNPKLNGGFKKAILKTTTWKTQNPKYAVDNDINITWSVNFELKQVSISEDEKKSKFVVENVYSSNQNDSWNKERYITWFNQMYTGGWIDIEGLPSNQKFEWIKDKTLSQEREDKLSKLLN
jgi:hypothetical protein